MERNKKKSQWAPQQIQLLSRLYPQFTSKKWKRIAEEFKAQGFNRTQIDCREKWINFVDPSINKNDWQQQQLRKLYEIHAQVGTRWCIVQKQIGRTQNKIKNRFYGTLRNFIRFVLNYFDSAHACFNYQISKLSPKFLNDMFNSTHNFSFMFGQVKEAIYSMGYKVEKKSMNERIRIHRPLYARLHQIILHAFDSLPNNHSRLTLNTDSQNQQIENPPSIAEQNNEVVQERVEVKRQEPEESIILHTQNGVMPSMTMNPLTMEQMNQMMQYQHLNSGMFYWYF